MAAMLTTSMVHVGDRYHNSDTHRAKNTPPPETVAKEVFWLKLDFLSISAVMAANFSLWVVNFGSTEYHRLLEKVVWGALAAVAVLALVLFERGRDTRVSTPSTPITEKCIKLCFAVQGFAFHLMVQTAPEGCSLFGYCNYIFAPGFLAYGLQLSPFSTQFEAHELFHLSILAGFVWSMACDASNLATPCALRHEGTLV
jgi:hypothetical protein